MACLFLMFIDIFIYIHIYIFWVIVNFIYNIVCVYVYGRQGRHAEIREQFSVVCFPCWLFHSFQWLSSGHPLSYPCTHTSTCTHRDMYVYICRDYCSMHACIHVQYSVSSYCLTIYLLFLRNFYGFFIYFLSPILLYIPRNNEK